MGIGLVAAAADLIAFFGQRGFLVKVVTSVQVFDILRNHYAFRVGPWAGPIRSRALIAVAPPLALVLR